MAQASETMAAQRFAVVAFVGKQPLASLARTTATARRDTNVVQKRLSISNVAGLTAGEQEA